MLNKTLSIFFSFIFLTFSSLHAQDISDNPEKDKYVGQYNGEGKRHGSGTYTWQDGTQYQGKWRNDLMEGRGTLRFANGNKYEGNFFKGQPFGAGVYTWANGDIYKGGFLDGKMHGRGVLITATGERHEGTWVNNQVNGEGQHWYPNGAQYIGEWKNGKRHGKGIMLYPNGDTEQGEWREDEYVPCDCYRESVSVEESYNESEAVFIAKVFEVETTDEGYDRVGMIVSEYWKGALYPKRKVYLRAGYTSCDYVFFENEEYLVYANPYDFDKSLYYPTKCSRTMNLEIPLAQRDIETLRKMTCEFNENDKRKVSFDFTDDPVCGCDGKEYKNPYQAYKNQVGHWWAGTCEEKKKRDEELRKKKYKIKTEVEEEKKEVKEQKQQMYNYVEEE
ncbi:hypothetical protein KMW28_12330 [Flammeovirga yaeyamensis]|uniref:MORN repeat protein n=1 Tax=Flammeovirga yaeyamensis TaxID=367791 RepID=A0AAX1N2P4_9BACT|nr:hypothetical protein [Flammeovirga yaeyamensis]QWG00440.1 hypothetical protein KMW28_12330 [Flammeovirga yaeyamensis]